MSTFELKLSSETALRIVKEFDKILIKIENVDSNYVLLDLEELNLFMRYIRKRKFDYRRKEIKKYFVNFKNNFNYPFMRCKEIYEDFDRKLKLTEKSKQLGKRFVRLTEDKLYVLLESHKKL